MRCLVWMSIHSVQMDFFSSVSFYFIIHMDVSKSDRKTSLKRRKKMFPGCFLCVNASILQPGGKTHHPKSSQIPFDECAISSNDSWRAETNQIAADEE